ncbi:uncharacterized protein LOC129298829 [Prosopis cineraria]|uniref:uncharacterized protein LOC129298829 n=1 Tax=Prosopis cineraria TaxID=364024 RepID=UPI00240FC359|nr:uncharacterized protein LOC129298829 [Prosopis cineraria]
MEAIDRSLYWRRPLLGGVKINVDGSFNNVLKSSNVGLVCKDEFGNFWVVVGRILLPNLLSSNLNSNYDWRCSDIVQDIIIAKESCNNVGFSLVARQSDEAANFLVVMGSKKMCSMG